MIGYVTELCSVHGASKHIGNVLVLSRAKETALFFQRSRILVGSSGFVLEESEAGKP